MNDSFKKTIFSRYQKHGIRFNTWEELKQATGIKDSDIPTCYYCKVELSEVDNFPNFNALTLDHKQPKARGGQSIVENVCLCCARCNTIKGIMREAIYLLFLELLSSKPNVRELVLEEMYWSEKNRAKHLVQKKDLSELV